MREKDIVLDVSQRFRELLDADTADDAGGGSWKVELTRETDVFVSLAGRSAYANSLNADRFMSIHSNAFADPSANGTETFSYSEGGKGAALRNLVQEEMINAWGLRNRGNKTANFAVLRETAMPAELHEMAFITNPTDAAKLASSAELQKAAKAHLRALQRHMGFAPYIPGTGESVGTGGIEVAVFGPDGPIAGAQLSVDGDQVGSTDDEGRAKVEELELGDHLLAVVAQGYRPAEQSLAVVANQAVATRFDLELLPDDCEEGEEGCDPEEDLEGGCSAAGGLGRSFPMALVLLALLLWQERRVRRRNR